MIKKTLFVSRPNWLIWEVRVTSVTEANSWFWGGGATGIIISSFALVVYVVYTAFTLCSITPKNVPFRVYPLNCRNSKDNYNYFV